ncbi:MAG: hypothetical protein IT289_01920 [Oligoflexia bacterium]|nr:hypothetical protein [Oligoflexia bacterium]
MKSILTLMIDAVLVCLLPAQSHGLVTINHTASVGFYRDELQKAHIPIFYTFGYEGVHSTNLETSLSLIMSRDLAEPNWRVFPAHAYVIVPLNQGFENAWFRRSRLQLGRQVLAQGFDFAVLDGAQSRIYWSAKGSALVFAGQTKNMDLFETSSSPIIGAQLQQEVFGYLLSGGYSQRETLLDTKIIEGSILKALNVFWSAPQILVKSQWNTSQSQPSQVLEELTFNPFDDLTLSFSHSYRTPRPADNEWRTFLFRIFSQSPMETQQATVQLRYFEPLEIDGFVRQLRFRGGQESEIGVQQEVSASLPVFDKLVFTGYVGHMRGFGGFAHDYGLQSKYDLSDWTRLQIEAASVQYDKVNGMSSWAYNVRSGLNFQLTPNLTAFGWLEVERNHRFEFDGKVMAHLSYFQ